MIRSFSCDNFRNVFCKDLEFARINILIGANNAGKSNFISALSFMRDLVSNSINHQPGQGVFQARHKLSAEETPSEYSIQFHLK